MISRFFIDRPIFASVLSIVITLAGAIAGYNLALAQFPPVTPTTVTVTCNYPGASAMDVAKAVAAPIEEYVNGVEGMYYMSSSCANDGSYSLNVTFQQTIDLNMAQVMVQNRVSLATQKLPDVIKQTGVTVKKQPPDILMGIAITSNDSHYDQLYLSNFALMQVRDELSRVEGVSDIKLFGQRDYSMRIWIDPTKLALRGMTADDVVRAIREQNSQVAAGVIGAPPSNDSPSFEVTLTTLGRLEDPEQFEDIILKTGPEGQVSRIKDVGRVEMAAKNADVTVDFDGKPTIFLAIWQLPDANALRTHDWILDKMHELDSSFPRGVKWDVAFDTTPYTLESIKEVFKTLGDAIILVAAVVLLFLRNWRSAIIPMIAVPVAIVGTFTFMLAIGFSLNTLTLFGLVLAIGIVVDDAIVVVEAVEHHIDEGLSPRDATIAAMDQVAGPVIAVGLVLTAVFVPCAFVSGITGQFFKQFAVTIAVSTVISAFNSLTLSPALAAVLLKPRDKHNSPPLPWGAFVLAGGFAAWRLLGLYEEHHPDFIAPAWGLYAAIAAGAVVGGIVSWPLNRFFGLAFGIFNYLFDKLGGVYAWFVHKLLYAALLVLVVYGGLLELTYSQMSSTPKGFIPAQDMGYLLVNVQLPDSASLERTREVLREMGKMARGTPGVKHATEVAGQSLILNVLSSNAGTMFINLQDYSERRDPNLSSDKIKENLQKQFDAKIRDAVFAIFGPPPVRGVGRAGGVTIVVENRGNLEPADLQKEADELVARINMTPGLTAFPQSFRANVPQLKIEPDIRECMAKGVSLKDFADTLQVFQGSLYINDFNLFGRSWQVIVQADSQFRDQIEDLHRLRVRNKAGDMIPLGSLATVREVNGPFVIPRYNMYMAATINAGAAFPLPGQVAISSAEAIDRISKVAKDTLSPSMAFEWSDMSFLELLAGDTATQIFGFAVMMVFLVLAAQYESWSMPLAVILVVPMCLLSATIGVRLFHLDINIFTRIGFVVLVGLASKNAILIVEFAKRKREQGEGRMQATVEACQLRLRPIVMTSLAFILGVLPLVLATGAGAEMRKALGVAVFSGMLGVTVFGLFLTPVFFFTIDWLGSLPLFASRIFRDASHVAFGAMRLRPLARVFSWRRRDEEPRPPRPRVSPPREPALKD